MGHDFGRVAKAIRRVAGALHCLQQLDDVLLRVGTFEMELVSKALAVGRDIGQAEFSPLIEFPLD